MDFDVPSKKEEKSPKTKKNKYMLDDHEEISKKFDEMEEILMELQKKEKEEKTYQTESPPKKESKGTPAKVESQDSDMKMPVFTFGGIGVNSFSSLGSLKNVKSPIFLKSKLGSDSK